MADDDIIPAQIQQLPGREFGGGGSEAFEAILGGIGSFMQAKIEIQQKEEQRRSAEMGQAFGALLGRGMIETGKPPRGYEGFMYGGSPFYYTQPGDPARASGDKSADINKTLVETYKLKQETGLVPQNPESLVPMLLKEAVRSPAFEYGSLKGNALQAGKDAVDVSYGMAEGLAARSAAARAAQPAAKRRGIPTQTSAGLTSTAPSSPTLSDVVLIKSPDGKVWPFKKTNKKGIQDALANGGKLA